MKKGKFLCVRLKGDFYTMNCYADKQTLRAFMEFYHIKRAEIAEYWYQNSQN